MRERESEGERIEFLKLALRRRIKGEVCVFERDGVRVCVRERWGVCMCVYAYV